MSFEYIYKYIIIGDSGVGKSCILMQFIKNEFDQNKENTVGVEFGNKVIDVDGTSVKLQIWDTAGQEQFKSITRSYYRAVAGALVVFDVTNENSFQNVKNWLEEARVNANPELVIILCGNKIDLENDRVVTAERARKLADEKGIKYIEVSAMKKVNVDSVFTEIARGIKRKVDNKVIDVNQEEFGVRRINDPAQAVKQRRKLIADVEEKRKNQSGGDCC